jgi:UDPglucose 6-dehydrogenase
VVETDVAAAMRKATVLFVCVGTPQREDGAADLSLLEGVARGVASNLNGYKVIVLKSTAPVETAEHIRQTILRYLSASPPMPTGDRNGAEFDMAVNPEFLREGAAMQDVLHPDRIVLGVDSDRAAALLLDIYRPLVERMGATVESSIIVTDINSAEIIKHASNAFLATKVSFANVVADLCEATGANIADVARGIGLDPRIGAQYLNAGIGYGGGCLPKDIQAFTWIAAQHGVDFSMLKEVSRVNEARVGAFISKVRRALRAIDGKTLAIWGLAFKPGTDDVREAPSLAIVRGLTDEGARLRLYDPEAMDEFRLWFGEDRSRLTYCASPEEATEGAEALLLLTEWREFLDVDLALVRERMAVPLIVDGRNLLDPAAVRGLGFEYHSVGRP